VDRNAGFQNVTVRVPDSIYGALLHDARDAERSLNGQIVHVLRRWYEGQRAVRVTDEELAALRREAAALPEEGGVLPTLERLAGALGS
jgi:hypothetical protein